jgi:HNH endonuclease
VTGDEFTSAIEEMGLRPKSFARLVPWDYRTVRDWLKKGVPIEQDQLLRQSLRKVAALVAPGKEFSHLILRSRGRPVSRVKLAPEGLTAEQLRELLDYDPDTGAFTWRVNTLKRDKGDTAGCPYGSLGYTKVTIGNQGYLAHRLAWLHVHGHWPKQNLDHKNGVPSDNRIANLRECDQSQNSANMLIRPNNTSGHRGVMWNNRSRKWQAHITYRGKHKVLGSFDTAERAAEVAKKARAAVWGEFAA